VADLIFGFDLTIDEEKEIAVKIVTQSYSVVGIDGKKLISSLVVGKVAISPTGNAKGRKDEHVCQVHHSTIWRDTLRR